MTHFCNGELAKVNRESLKELRTVKTLLERKTPSKETTLKMSVDVVKTLEELCL